MKNWVLNKIKYAEQQLQTKLPEEIVEFISSLKSHEIFFKEEEWFFFTLADAKDNSEDNFIIESSEHFRKIWGVNGVVIASNGIGDNLVLLPDKKNNELKDQIFVSLHEYAEIRLFAEDIFSLQLYGPKDYFSLPDFYIKLEETGAIEGNQASDFYKYEEDDKVFGIGYGNKSQLDDWIDDERFDKASDIIAGLEELSSSETDHLKIWALNKLSDIYLRGFGTISQNIAKALEMNHLAISLHSHKAYSNLAAAYFAGIGVDKDLKKALTYITKAQELSKNPSELDILSGTKRKGQYSNEIKLIKKAMKDNR
jgi:hypothetical protein